MRPLLSVGISALALALSTHAAAQRRPDLNAFIDHKVSNTHTLVREVETDPAVSDRYQRHFSMSRKEVVNYLSSLHRTNLAHSGEYTVYSIPQDGHVKMHHELLPKGMPIFADAHGRPTLIVKCGNPVVLGPERNRARRANPLTAIPVEKTASRQMSMLTPKDAEALTTDDDLVALMPAIPGDVVEELAPVAAASPGAAGATSIATVPASSVAGHAFPWLAGLPLLAPIIIGLDHNGGGGGSTPAPEPTTWAALGLGLVAVGRRRRKS